MKIVAKYNGKCRLCGAYIAAGSPIEWSRDGGTTCASGCKQGSKSKAIKEATKVGECVGQAHLYENLGFCKASPAGEVGKTFRAGPRAGQWAGKIVTVIGCHRTYLSRDDAEDVASADDAGFTFRKWVREATEAEAATVLAEEAKKAAERKAKEEEAAVAKEAAERNAAACRALLQGLVSSDGYISLIESHGAVVGEMPIGLRGKRIIRQVTLKTGDQALLVSDSSYDDDRSSLYATQEVIEKVWQATKEALKTTPEEAAQWLSNYASCYGAGYFRYIAGQNS